MDNVKRTKLLFLSNTSFSHVKFRLPLLETLAKDPRYEVYVASGEDEYTLQLTELPIQFVGLRYMNAKGKNPLNEIRLIVEINDIFKRIKPDLVFQYTIKPYLYGAFCSAFQRLRCISVVSGLGYIFINNNLLARSIRLLYQLSFRFNREAWFLNPDDRDEFIKRKLIPASKTFLLPGEGVNIHNFSPNTAKVAEETGKTIFLLIARPLYDKGILEYISAAREIKKKYPDTVFVLMGKATGNNPNIVQPETLQEWVREGTLEHWGVAQDVRPFINRSHCIVLPSYREGLSMALMEGGAMGKPLIATNVPGCKELVRDGENGFLCKSRSSDDLVRVLDNFLQLSTEKRRKMGEKSRELIVREFSHEVIIQHYLNKINRHLS